VHHDFEPALVGGPAELQPSSDVVRGHLDTCSVWGGEAGGTDTGVTIKAERSQTRKKQAVAVTRIASVLAVGPSVLQSLWFWQHLKLPAP
jgi:hypothetical protein